MSRLSDRRRVLFGWIGHEEGDEAGRLRALVALDERVEPATVPVRELPLPGNPPALWETEEPT